MTKRIDYARMKRDAGMALSSYNSGHGWFLDATEVLIEFLSQNPTMHVDQLWDHGLSTPASPRGLGAVIKSASKKNLMEMIIVDEGYIAALPSTRSNMQLKPVWRSNLFALPLEDIHRADYIDF